MSFNFKEKTTNLKIDFLLQKNLGNLLNDIKPILDFC